MIIQTKVQKRRNTMKKRFHKLILIAIIFTFVFSMNACSKNEGNTSDNKETEITTEKVAEFEKGTQTETGFESEWLDLRFTLPEGFVMSTEEELLALIDLGKDYIDENSDLNIDYDNLESYYEMMASDVTTGASVLLMVENLKLSNITLEQYLETLKTQLETLSYTSVADVKTETIAGNEYSNMQMQGNQNGVVFTQYYVLRKIDNKITGFIITLPENSSIEEYNTIINSFTAYSL